MQKKSLFRGMADGFRGMVRKLAGTDVIQHRLDQMAGRMNYTVLEASEHAKYLIPVDYLPSCDLRPRWGYGSPTHARLAAMFLEDKSHYFEVIEEIRRLGPYLEKIDRNFQPETPPKAGWIGGPFAPIDLAILYRFVHACKPATYLEIGSGISTCFAKRAVEDHGLKTKIISIDPEPRSSIDALCDEVIRSPLETTDLSLFHELEPGDIVFMDGSHRSFMNSDVTVFMLDVLPGLKPGVVVHFHDIFLPDDYPDMFLHWYWSEQYILGAYLLAARDRIRILMPSNFIEKSDELRHCLEPPVVGLDGGEPFKGGGGSLWFTHESG